MFGSPFRSFTSSRLRVFAGVCLVGILATLVIVFGPAGLSKAQTGESRDNLLALTWQPAFCEYRPGVSECVVLNAGDNAQAARQLSLHGLWPQPRGNDYCGVPEAVKALDRKGRWSSLPAPGIGPDIRKQLTAAMPGTASHLDRHEWIKHGTCYNAAGGAEEYYRDSLRLVSAVNASAVRDYLVANIGQKVTGGNIRAQFDKAFGPGTGSRVSVVCRSDGARSLIREIRISLRGTIEPDVHLAALMLAADPVPPGCIGGIVDPVGLQ